MPQSASQLDAVVIGGGPAGTTVATLLAQRGYRVELFERERFPRFHIGESLIPQTYWVLRRLGMLDRSTSSTTSRTSRRRPGRCAVPSLTNCFSIMPGSMA